MQLDLSPHFKFVQEAHPVHQPSLICLSDSVHLSHFQCIGPTYMNIFPSVPTCSYHVRIRTKKMNPHVQISLQKHQLYGRSSHYLLFKTHQYYRNVFQWELPRRSLGTKILKNNYKLQISGLKKTRRNCIIKLRRKNLRRINMYVTLKKREM